MRPNNTTRKTSHNRKDLTGKTFGRWTVLAFSHVNVHRFAYWLCRCECGTERVVNGTTLRNGDSTSCGCYRTEQRIKATSKHGHWQEPIYAAWQQMRARCSNPNHIGWSIYGGRGITVCTRWQTFSNFLADMGERPDGHTLERIDNNGPYSPENCKWATKQVQSANMRSNHYLTHDGVRLHVQEWARKLDIRPSTLYSRIRYGWSDERILTEPVNPKCHHKTALPGRR